MAVCNINLLKGNCPRIRFYEGIILKTLKSEFSFKRVKVSESDKMELYYLT